LYEKNSDRLRIVGKTESLYERRGLLAMSYKHQTDLRELPSSAVAVALEGPEDAQEPAEAAADIEGTAAVGRWVSAAAVVEKYPTDVTTSLNH
jgi:hypothetical protein